MKFFRTFVILIILVLGIFPTFNVVAFADGINPGSDIIEDLQADEKFNIADYPENNSDYSLYFVTIAESEQKELLLYLYQPCVEKDLRATSVNLSVGIYSSLKYENYTLTFLNSSGTLYKYKVNGVTVADSAARYYAISSVYRLWDKDLDASGSQQISQVPFKVGKMIAFSTINGSEYCECRDLETILVTDKHVGFVRYANGFLFGVGVTYRDSHYVAFSTDKPMDRLRSARVGFYYQSYDTNPGAFGAEVPTWGNKIYSQVNINEDDDTVTSDKTGPFVESYSWKRIQTVSEFIASEENTYLLYEGVFVDIYSDTTIGSEAKQAISDLSWVLRFYETDYQLDTSSVTTTGHIYESSVRVSDVTILQLEFETDGVVYNLGVVDNMATGSTTPDNDREISVTISEDLKDVIKTLITILAFVLGAVLIIVILPYIIKFIGFVLKILIAPFKWLFADSKKNKKRR